MSSESNLPPIIGTMGAVEGAAPERPARRRQRKPTLARALAEAKKAGVNIASATLSSDGAVSLTFGQEESATAAPGNELDQWRAKRARALEGR
jgi:hypothetical protein